MYAYLYIGLEFTLTLYMYVYIDVGLTSHIIQLTPHELSAEPRNSASAEALAVATRPKEASREKTRPPPVSRGYSP